VVQRGQYLERGVVVKSGDVSLDALFHRGHRAPPCVIAAPHPALGGSMTVPAIAELAWALTRAGFATLRFDYRGVGASQGRSRHAAGATRIAQVDDELEDLRAAVEQLVQSTRAEDVCVVGYSFGAAVALAAAADAKVSRLVLIAPPTSAWDFSALGALQKPVLVVCAHHDDLCNRSRLKVPANGQLAVIPHADHSFRRGLQEMGKTVASWVGGGPPGPDLAMPPAPGDARDSEAFREVELPECDGPALELDDT
jgi:alpha/beta superfamily hydrolase